MIFYNFFRISRAKSVRYEGEEAQIEYRRLRSQTFWGVTIAYCLFYIGRMTMSVVKEPLISHGILTSAQIGLIGSAMLIAYAVGKFVNGFIADYCNIKRFMATGLAVSAFVNIVMGILGLWSGYVGLSSLVLLILFSVFWGINGWAQSMGAPPGVISLSRWFPINSRGTYYSIFCATPYLGKFLSLVLTSHIVLWLGWQSGFIFSALACFIGVIIILSMVSDTPESKGLPTIQALTGDSVQKTDTLPTSVVHKAVFKHWGIWVIALSSAFVYIAQYGISNWGVLFLQKAKSYSLQDAALIIGISEGIGIIGTVFAGWLSDKVFKGNRLKPVILCGAICLATLALFLFCDGGMALNILYLSVSSLTMGALYCIVAGLMALDIVPRKATGAALGIVGISSYLAAGLQDIISGFLIAGDGADKSNLDFQHVTIFWLSATLISFILPLLGWKFIKKKVEIE